MEEGMCSQKIVLNAILAESWRNLQKWRDKARSWGDVARLELFDTSQAVCPSNPLCCKQRSGSRHETCFPVVRACRIDWRTSRRARTEWRCTMMQVLVAACADCTFLDPLGEWEMANPGKSSDQANGLGQSRATLLSRTSL